MNILLRIYIGRSTNIISTYNCFKLSRIHKLENRGWDLLEISICERIYYTDFSVLWNSSERTWVIQGGGHYFFYFLWTFLYFNEVVGFGGARFVFLT